MKESGLEKSNLIQFPLIRDAFWPSTFGRVKIDHFQVDLS